MTALNLKQSLATNISRTLVMKKRAGTYPNKFKPGEMQHLYIFDENGTEYSYYANDREEESLSHYMPGQEVQVLRQEKVMADGKRISFQIWGTPHSAEMEAGPQLKSNTANIREEKQAVDHQQAQKTKEVMISLAGLFQAHVNAGRTNEEALPLAVAAREMILDKAIKIASK